jgi:hypothetical protein
MKEVPVLTMFDLLIDVCGNHQRVKVAADEMFTVPRGSSCLKFEDDDLNDMSVSFLDAHDITVHNFEGHKVYRLRPSYVFETLQGRENFLIKVREREHLDKFYVEKIFHRGDLVAQYKVVRLWKKVVETKAKQTAYYTTLAFLGRDGKPYELSLVDFHRCPQLQGNKVELISSEDGMRTVFEFGRPLSQVRERRRSRRSLSLSSSPTEPPREPSPAQKFKDVFEHHHPATSKSVELPAMVFDDDPLWEDPAESSTSMPLTSGSASSSGC